MEKIETIGSKKELNMYILIYCAHADFKIAEEEKEFLETKTNPTIFKKIMREFSRDNDYQSIEKIQSSLKLHNYTEQEKSALKEDIKELFISDGSFELLEKNLFRSLKQLFV